MTNQPINEFAKLRRETATKSVRNFITTYLQHHVEYSFSESHEEVLEDLQTMFETRGMKAAIAAPRAWGKSTIFLGAVLYGICTGHEKFICLFSAVVGNAEQMMENVKKELMENEKIKLDFPDVFEFAGLPKPPRWTTNEIQTRNGVKVKTYGTGQSPRGVKFGKERPSLIILDDIETSNTDSKEVKIKLRNWMLKVVLNLGFEKTNYVFIGNIHSYDCLLAEFTSKDKHPTWIKHIYKAVISGPKNEDLWERWSAIYNSRPGATFGNECGPAAAKKYYECCKESMLEGVKLLWPQRWDYYSLREKLETDPKIFRAEFQNEPSAPGSSVFNVDEFIYWSDHYRTKEDLLRAIGDQAVFYAACDPSLGGELGCYSAIVVLVHDARAKAIYVLEADICRRQPDVILEDCLAVCQNYGIGKFGFEVNGGQEYLVQQFEKMCMEKIVRTEIVRIKNTQNKSQRIQTIQPLTKKLLHFSRDHKLLLEQLREFQGTKYQDGPDALEMAIQVINQSAQQGQFNTEFALDVLQHWVNTQGIGRSWVDPITGRTIYLDKPATNFLDSFGPWR